MSNHPDPADEHSIVIVVLVLLKISIIVILLAIGIQAYWMKPTQMPNRKGIIVLMVFMIIILIGLLLFDLGTKYIFAYFLLQISVNYTTMCALYLLLKNVEVSPGLTLSKKFRWFFILMNLCFIIEISLAFIPSVGAFCTTDRPYPRVISNLPILIGSTLVFAVYLKCKDFYLPDDEKVMEETSPLLQSGEWKQAETKKLFLA